MNTVTKTNNRKTRNKRGANPRTFEIQHVYRNGKVVKTIYHEVGSKKGTLV